MSDAPEVPIDETPDAPTVTPDVHAGRMIVDLYLNASDRPVPSVSFDPPGQFTPGLLHNNLMLFIKRLAEEQAKVRHGTVAATTDAPPARRSA